MKGVSDRMMMLKTFIKERIDDLNEDASDSRKVCARLRRAIGKPLQSSPDIWEIILSDALSGEYMENAIFTTLSLYALHHQGKQESMNDGKTNFGAAIAKLKHAEYDNTKAVRRRFNTMITSLDLTELAYHAKGLIQLLRANDIKMDYPTFAMELLLFQFPEKKDKLLLNWGRQFYHANDHIKTENEGTDEK